MKNLAIILFGTALMTACSPTVKLQAPDKPIEINMNVHIDQEVRVKVDRDLEKSITSNPELFGVKKK